MPPSMTSSWPTTNDESEEARRGSRPSLPLEIEVGSDRRHVALLAWKGGRVRIGRISETSRLLLVEGLPGSGKTATSREIAALLRSRGHACGWAPEEDKAHPVLDRRTRGLHRRQDYDEICLRGWRHFLDDNRDGRWVLEGCALQSTVRFMFEQGWSVGRIVSYWQRFAEVVGTSRTRMLYLMHPQPESFLREHTLKVRHEVWHRICDHIASTPRGIQLAAEDGDVPIEFWLQYGELCDELVALAPFPVLTLDISGGWRGLAAMTVDWLDRPPQPLTVTR